MFRTRRPATVTTADRRKAAERDRRSVEVAARRAVRDDAFGTGRNFI